MEQTKKCTKCGVEKAFSCFNKNRGCKQGLKARCKACQAKYNVEHYLENTEKIAEKNAEYRRENADKIAKRMSEYRRSPGRRANEAKNRVARTFLKKATRLAETYADEIKEIYRQANETAELAGLEIHVDHIIPLQGVTEDGNRVSGLHVPWNLRPVYAKTNLRKNNKARQADALAW